MKYNSQKKQIQKKEKNIEPIVKSSKENFLQQHSKILSYVLLGLSFLLSILLFNPDVHVGGDDSMYIESAYKFFHGTAFPDWHGPFYPIFLSLFYGVFGFNVILFKLLSTVFFAFSVFFTFKVFEKITDIFTAFFLSLFSAFSYMLQVYASMTYSEPMFMFMQSLLLYLYFDFTSKNEAIDLKKIIISYSLLAVVAYLTYLTRSVAVAVIPFIFVVLLFEKNKKPAIVFLSATVVCHLITALYKKIVWKTSSVSFMEQLDANFLVDPYKPQKGYETIGGFFQRFFDNCDLYLSKHLIKLFGFKAYDSREHSMVVAIVVIVLFLACGVYIFKKNRKLFFVFLYVLVMTGVTFFMVQKLWDQERLIMIYFPLIAGIVLYTLNSIFNQKYSFVPKFFAVVVFLCITFRLFMTGEFNVSNNFTVGEYASYTDDWENYMKASKWAGENLKEGSVVACRKSQMSWIASSASDRVKFYGIYKLYSNDADTMQHYLLDSIKSTHVIMANLRLNPYEYNGKTITTVRYSLRNLIRKYPYSLKLVKQFGTQEPAYIFEFADYKEVDINKLYAARIVSPENAYIWEQCAMMYFEKQQFDMVIKDMDEAIKYNAKHFRFPYLQAIAYNRKGDNESALKKIDEAIKLNSQNGEVLYNKAVLLYEMQKYSEAFSVLQTVKTLDFKSDNIIPFENELKRLMK